MGDANKKVTRLQEDMNVLKQTANQAHLEFQQKMSKIQREHDQTKSNINILNGKIRKYSQTMANIASKFYTI